MPEGIDGAQSGDIADERLIPQESKQERPNENKENKSDNRGDAFALVAGVDNCQHLQEAEKKSPPLVRW